MEEQKRKLLEDEEDCCCKQLSDAPDAEAGENKINYSELVGSELKMTKVPFIGKYEEADEFLRDNEYILRGYRINYTSFCLVLKSLFMCHNETVNIWTHLIGLVTFFCTIFYIGISLATESEKAKDGGFSLFETAGELFHIVYESNDPVKDSMDQIDSSQGLKNGVSKIPLIIHVTCAMFCLFLSSTFHLFCCHSKEALNILSRFDYGGIAILIAGSCVPQYLYTFYCHQNAYIGYIYTSIIAVACATAFVVTLIPKFDAPKYRKCRAILFVIVGLSSSIPGVHTIFFRDHKLSPEPPIFLLALGGAIYIMGAVIYGMRFPEKCFKGKFDYIGNSHNIWHCFVLAGAGTHFAASIFTYLSRLDALCPS